jgi:ubiquitin C-terminal hydrolase
MRTPDSHGEALNVLLIPQMKTIISSWQKFGAQQDASEFLFYMLNGMHEETRWGSASGPSAQPEVEASASAEQQDAPSEENAWSHLVKTSRRQAEERTAGLHEDSPITRIFGGVMQSAVRTKGAKVDSVSLEPFNHLALDISDVSVKSVHDALALHFKPEEVNDGQATRRLQIKSLPKVLILCLKRFAFNASKGCPQKVKKPIQYDQKLSWHRSWFAEADKPPPEYCISAVICHHGEAVSGGHYTAIVRYNAEWYLYDDTTVQKMEGREVAAHQASAYLLVYQASSTVDMTP